VLSQGTGIGLFLCKNLIELLGGTISIDDEYDSGIEGCPGTRFVVNLNVPALDDQHLSHYENQTSQSSSSSSGSQISETGTTGSLSNDAYDGDGRNEHRTPEANASVLGRQDEQLIPADTPLYSEGKGNSVTFSDTPVTGAPHKVNRQQFPETLSVLLVDDDSMIRKMFARAVKKVFPGWAFREAASGEAALQLIEPGSAEQFDLIFMDMYMASVDRQLLGTETVQKLRLLGVESCVCGMSANDKEAEFRQAGADTFLMKPFPCSPPELRRELARVLASRGNWRGIQKIASSDP